MRDRLVGTSLHLPRAGYRLVAHERLMTLLSGSVASE